MTSKRDAHYRPTQDEDLREVFTDALGHFKAMLKEPPGTLTAAQLETTRKFLLDQGVSIRSFAISSGVQSRRLEEALKDYDGDQYESHEGGPAAGAAE